MSRLRNLFRLLHWVRTVQGLSTKMPLAHDASVGAVADDLHHLEMPTRSQTTLLNSRVDMRFG